MPTYIHTHSEKTRLVCVFLFKHGLGVGRGSSRGSRTKWILGTVVPVVVSDQMMVMGRV